MIIYLNHFHLLSLANNQEINELSYVLFVLAFLSRTCFASLNLNSELNRFIYFLIAFKLISNFRIHAVAREPFHVLEFFLIENPFTVNKFLCIGYFCFLTYFFVYLNTLKCDILR